MKYKMIASSKQGCTTKQVQDLIIRKNGGIRYHYTHIYRLMHKWGFKQKVPRKSHVKTASKEEKEDFKRARKILLDNLKKEFTVVSLDESFFFYDSLVRKVMDNQK